MISRCRIPLRQAWERRCLPILSSDRLAGLFIVRDWRLTRLVDEVSRYRFGKIIVMDAQLGNHAVTGTFHLDDFIGKAQGLFGASVQSFPGGVVLLL